jgi:hypothetical protein
MGNISVKTLDIILDHLNYEIAFESKGGFGLPVLGEI